MWQPLIRLLILFKLADCANILGVFLIPSFSHQAVYQPIWKELSLRGHKVTVITPDPLNDPSLTNLTEINMDFTYKVINELRIQNAMVKEESSFQVLRNIYKVLEILAESLLSSKEVKELIADENKKFDLILVECFHPTMYGFGSRFNAPIIGVCPFGLFTIGYDIIGNPNHPIVYPDFLLGYANSDLTLWQKITSVVFNLWARYYHNYVVLPQSQEIVKKYFGDDIGDIGEIERNQSMYFHNVDPLLYPPRPNVPVVIELGMMHIKPVQPLPRDLQKILDDATEGVVYFSLGSNVKSVNLYAKLKETLVDALSELAFTVLWKWESDDFPEKLANVITRKWFPQQDLLAHRNIKVFVTQGGLQSIEEAISRVVPILGMPFILDQPMNMKRMVEWGAGLELDPFRMTKDDLKNCIMEIATNKKYKERIREMRDSILDRPMTGLENAVWWSEYVIRHKGARHLRSPTADISWYDYFLLDVILTFLVIFSVIIYISLKLIQMVNTHGKAKLKVS